MKKPNFDKKLELFTRASSAAEVLSILDILPDPDTVLANKGGELFIYRQLTYDSHVDSCITSREAGMLSCEYEFRVDSLRRNETKALDFCNENFGALDMERLFRDIQEAVYFGFSALEKIYRRDGGNIVFDDVIGRPQEWFKFNHSNQPLFLSKEHPTEGELVDMNIIELVRYRHSYRNPYGERKAARFFWPVVFKKSDWKFWLRFVEKYGGALMYIITDEPDLANRNLMLNMLEDMIETGVGVFKRGGVGDSLLTIDVNKGASNEIYTALHAACDAEISKSILGQTLTTEQGEVGSQALGKVHQDVRQDIIESDKKMVASAMNRLVRDIVSKNFNIDTFPIFHFFEEEQVNLDKAEMYTKLYSLGVRFKKELLAKEFNLDDAGFDLTEPVATTPGAVMAQFAEQEEAQNGVIQLSQHMFTKIKNDAAGIDKLIEDNAGNFNAGFDAFYNAIEMDLNDAKTIDEAMDKMLNVINVESDAATENLTSALITADIHGRWNGEHYRTVSFAESDLIDKYDAAEFLKMRIPVTKETFDELGEKYRNYAFTVTGDFKEEQIAGILQSLIDAKENKIGYKDWLAQNGERWKLSPERLKMIYRQNILSAESAGRYAQMKADVDIAPFWQYIAVLDKNTRPEHAAFNLMIRRHDDPIWDSIYPPNGFNCRCMVRSLSPEYLKAKGVDPETIPSGNPDMGEVLKNTGNRKEFEEFIKPSLTRFDKDGKILFAPDEGFKNNVGKDFTKWIEIKQSVNKDEWKNIITETVDLNKLLKSTPPANWTAFDYKNENAVAYLRDNIGDSPLFDPKGYPVILGDPKRFVGHIQEKQSNRLQYLSLIRETVEKPDAVYITLQEMTGEAKGEKRQKAGFVKLSRNYVKKINDKEYMILVSNFSREYPRWTIWTVMPTDKPAVKGKVVFKK